MHVCYLRPGPGVVDSTRIWGIVLASCQAYPRGSLDPLVPETTNSEQRNGRDTRQCDLVVFEEVGISGQAAETGRGCSWMECRSMVENDSLRAPCRIRPQTQA